MDEIKVVIEPAAGELGIKVQPSGVPGPPGSNGLSAYEMAVQNGFVGTVTEWLESLKGSPGRDGEDGEQGIPGETGATGSQGEPGQTGAQGTPGVDGADGAPGADGYTPVKGVDYFTDDEIADIQTQVLAEADNRYANALINTASGSGSVLIPDAWDALIQDMTVSGRSVQPTTKGVQLFDASKPVPVSGTTLEVSDNGRVINISSESQRVSRASYDDNSLAGKTIYVTVDEMAKLIDGPPMSFQIRYADIDGVVNYYNLVATGSRSVQIPADATDVRIHLFANNNSSEPMASSVTFTGARICLSPNESWEPYTGGIPSPNPDYPQPITSVDNPVIVSTDDDSLISTIDLTGYTLRGIDDVRDRIERRDGVWGIERQYGERSFDGTESWALQSVNASGVANFALGIPEIGASTRTLVTHFQRQSTTIANTTTTGFYKAVGIIYIRLTRDDLPTQAVSAFKSFLANEFTSGAPVTFLYPLAEPGWEPFPDPIQQQFNNLRTYRGDNSTVYIVSEIAPELSVTYIQDSNKVVQQLKLDMAEQEIDVLAVIDQLKIDNNLI